MTYKEAITHIDEQIETLRGDNDPGAQMALAWLEYSKVPGVLEPDEIINIVEEWLAERVAIEQTKAAVFACIDQLCDFATQGGAE